MEPDHSGTDGAQPVASRRRRGGTALRHRLPVRLRRYWKSSSAVLVALLAIVLVFGQAEVRPYISSTLVTPDVITNNIEGHGDLFDGGNHSIKISYGAGEYAHMMKTFREEGVKEFIRATITIDGTVIKNVAIRLKGNSTLMSLRGGNGMLQMPRNRANRAKQHMGGAGKGQGQVPQGGANGQQGQGMPGGMSMTQLSEDEPAKLPWLISFNEFSAGRAYQGHFLIALRPKSAGSATAVNESLAMELTAQAGQTTQDYTLAGVSVNGSKSVPRKLVDIPDIPWANNHGNGVLYKARAGGSFDYVGEDPTDYLVSFEQINAKDSYDLQPVIDLVRFVSKSDDEEFGKKLDDYLDVKSFARYLALQKLISNGDAIGGPGNNYYLWYDVEKGRFTVLSWDLNLSFSGMGAMMKHGPAGKGQVPGKGQFPDRGRAPGRGQDPGGLQMGKGSGVLKDRFLDNDHFKNLYQEAYSDLYQKLIASGSATKTLDKIVSRASAAGDEGATTAGKSIREKLNAEKPRL